MTTVADILAAIDRSIPSSGAAGWDVSGLQLGDRGNDVERVGICHEVTDEVVERCESEPIQLLVTYHPLLFRPTTRVTADRGPSGRAYRLIRADTALAVTHTSFDVTDGGTADALASVMELEDAVGFGPAEGAPSVKLVTFVPGEDVDRVSAALGSVGAGVIGDYTGCSFRVEGIGTFRPGDDSEPAVGSVGVMNHEPETRVEMIVPQSRRDAAIAALVAAHPYEEPAFDVYEVAANHRFIGRIGSWQGSLAELGELAAERLGSEGLRVSGPAEHRVDRVAVVPGSGADFCGAARAVGADAIVTGDVSHHRVVGALDLGLGVVDPGHTPTERPGVRELVERVRSIADTEVVDLADADPTPWR